MRRTSRLPLNMVVESKFYDQVYKEEKAVHYKRCKHYPLWKQSITYLKEIDKLYFPKILEIGCGSGQFAHFLEDEGYEDYKGFDYSEEGINKALKTCKQEFYVGDATCLKNYVGEFNTVLAIEVLEHFEDDLKILSYLKPGTNIIFSVPSFSCEGHYRHFGGTTEIANYYFDLINIKQMQPFRILGTRAYWTVCRGVIK